MPLPVTEMALTDDVSALYDRVARVERRPGPERIPFSYAGALALSTSTPWIPNRGSTVLDARALLGTAGTSSTVVTVYVNGASVGTVTLTSGQTNEGASLTSTALVADTDLVTVGVTTVGTGAADLTVLVRVA